MLCKHDYVFLLVCAVVAAKFAGSGQTDPNPSVALGSHPVPVAESK
jgi:hypothetical protein